MDIVLEDVNDPSFTLSQIMHMVEQYKEKNPDMDVYLDGDARAIMARPHSESTEVR